MSLPVGSSLQVEYAGTICLPIGKSQGHYVGKLEFPPSDLISDKYTLSFIYPDVLKGNSLRISLGDGGRYRQSERLDQFNSITSDEMWELPSGFKPNENEQAARVQVKRELMSFDVIKLEWVAQ